MSKVLRGLLVVALLSVFALPFARPHAASAEDTSLDLHAYLLVFDKSALSVPAGANVTLTLYNDENYVAHNLAVDIPGVDATKACLGKCTSKLTFTAPDPGVYKFYCTLHEAMVGELDVLSN